MLRIRCLSGLLDEDIVKQLHVLLNLVLNLNMVRVKYKLH